MEKYDRYLSTTWYDPRVEVRPSSIHGLGMFARQPIQAGDVVVRLGGTVMTQEAFQAFILTVPRYNAVQIGEETHLVDVATTIGGMNHSCDANLWMGDEVTVVARCDICGWGRVDPRLRLVHDQSHLDNAALSLRDDGMPRGDHRPGLATTRRARTVSRSPLSLSQ
jgi:hypothetical protein